LIFPNPANLLLFSLCITYKQINPIWNFFAKVESDTSKAQCIECIKLYSLGSRIPGKQAVHSLKSHIEKNHKDLHSPYLSNVADRNNVVKPAKKAKLEESPAKTLDTFPANICCFSRTSCNIRVHQL